MGATSFLTEHTESQKYGTIAPWGKLLPMRRYFFRSWCLMSMMDAVLGPHCRMRPKQTSLLGRAQPLFCLLALVWRSMVAQRRLWKASRCNILRITIINQPVVISSVEDDAVSLAGVRQNFMRLIAIHQDRLINCKHNRVTGTKAPERICAVVRNEIPQLATDWVGFLSTTGCLPKIFKIDSAHAGISSRWKVLQWALQVCFLYALSEPV